MTIETEQNDGAATNEAEGTPNAEGQKPEGENASAENASETKPAEGEKPAVVEELKFDVPEGVELDEADLGAFKDILKDESLTKQQLAQKVLDIAVNREKARAEGFVTQVNGWAEAVKADKELGVPENLAIAKNVIDTFGNDEVRNLLNSTGMGNHPEVVRLCLKIGKAISEDTFTRGKQAPETAAGDAATILYG